MQSQTLALQLHVPLPHILLGVVRYLAGLNMSSPKTINWHIVWLDAVVRKPANIMRRTRAPINHSAIRRVKNN